MFAEQLEKAGVKNLAAAVRKKNPKTFNEVLNAEFLRENEISLKERTKAVKLITVGKPNVAGEKKKSAGSPQSPFQKRY